MEPEELNVEELVEQAKRARQELDKINTRIEEATCAHMLATNVHTDALKNQQNLEGRIRAAGILLHIAFAEVERLKVMHEAGQRVIDDLRSYNIGAVDDALEIICIGGITFG